MRIEDLADLAATRVASALKENVYATAFSVQVEGLPVGMYVERIRYGERSIISGALDLSSGEPGELQIAVRSGTGSIHGKVTDTNGNGLAGVQVLLWTAPESEEDDKTEQRRWFVRSDTEGRFNLGAC